METMEAIFTRRSVRAFRPGSVPDELLRQILEAGAASPSGGNVQAWAFVLVRAPERVAALRSLAPGIIGEPGAVLAICRDIDRDRRLGGSGGERMSWMSVGLAVDNILLAAHALGLGACPVGSFHPTAVSSFLDLPVHLQPVLLVTLGYPRGETPSPGRRSILEVCFAEQWGAPYGIGDASPR